MKLKTSGAVVVALLATAICGAGTIPVVRHLANGMGSVKGHVLSAQGSPVVGCPVKFYAPPDLTGTGGAKKDAGLGAPQPQWLGGAKNSVAAQAITNDKGEFSVKQLKPGSYRYIAGNRATGMAGGSVTVEADKEASIDVKLQAPTPR